MGSGLFGAKRSNVGQRSLCQKKKLFWYVIKASDIGKLNAIAKALFQKQIIAIFIKNDLDLVTLTLKIKSNTKNENLY